MISINTKKIPNPKESMHWVDLNENPYGGIIKYYDDNINEWVYLDEPIFQNSAASKLTYEQLDVLESVSEIPESIASLQQQINVLDDTKADKDDVLSKEYADKIHADLTVAINKNAGDIITTNNSLTTKIVEGDDKNNSRIEEVNYALNSEIDSLRDAVQKGYDDTEIRNALAEKTSYTYVEQQIQKITGVPPTVLDTLEELANALGDDPNFAATITKELGTKLNKEQVTKLFNELSPSLLVETDPTVPQWAKRSTKPTYTADEVGALPTGTFIPQRTSQLTNDAGFLTSLEVISLINNNKQLSTTQYNKINKLDSYVVYNITEDTVNIPTNYDTIVLNVPETITTLNIHFAEEPVVGSKFRLYVNNKISMTVVFHTLRNEILHSVIIPAITRFDITAIDLTDYSLTAETNEILTTENGGTIVVNILDGYIIDYVNMQNDLTWYEGE